MPKISNSLFHYHWSSQLKYTNLIEGGNSFICSIIGHRSFVDELNTDIPSVFNLNVMLFDDLVRKPPAWHNLHNFL